MTQEEKARAFDTILNKIAEHRAVLKNPKPLSIYQKLQAIELEDELDVMIDFALENRERNDTTASTSTQQQD